MNIFLASIRKSPEKQALVREWIAELKGGAYEQGRKCLQDACGKFCCLGVALDLIDNNGWLEPDALVRPHRLGLKKGLPIGGFYMGRSALSKLGLSASGMRELTLWNDLSALPFQLIADRIEQNLEEVLGGS